MVLIRTMPRLIAAALIVTLPAAGVQAQPERRGSSPLVLPRPGLDPVVRRIGTAELRLTADASVMYDTNVYATSANGRDELKAIISPRAQIDWQSATTALHLEGYGDLRRYFDLSRENSTEFGIGAEATTRPGANQSLTSQLRYDRLVQLRTDPEARAPVSVSPRKINVVSGEVGYSYRSGPIEVRVTPGFDRYAFLDRSERDRSLASVRGAARITYQGAAPVGFFLEGFGTRRDFDLRTDFSGVDRDATTYGALVGVSRDVSGRLRGSIGAGVFRTDQDDRALRSYTGFAVNGRVTWSPRARTALTFDAFRGDVATVRAGASGRTDTRASVRIDQEVRHNLIWFAQAGWRKSTFRGIIPNKQDVLEGQFGIDYLLSPQLSLFAVATAARRNATLPLDEFNRTTGQLGVRTRF